MSKTSSLSSVTSAKKSAGHQTTAIRAHAQASANDPTTKKTRCQRATDGTHSETLIPMKIADLIQTLTATHHSCQRQAVQAVNSSLVLRNWLFGYYIVEFEQAGEDRAEYGSRLLPRLSEDLKQAGIPGCSSTHLKQFRQFYQTYPAIGQAVPDQFTDPLALKVLKQNFLLSWTHYQILITISDPDERKFYEIEATTGQWSTRELERQISTALFDRLALSRNKAEIEQLASQGQIVTAPRDVIKDPYILEFLELEQYPSYSESELENAIINKLEQFLLELGKGFLFEARQKRFSFEEDHFYVDLVFYNRLLRSYVLVDLKLDKLTHQDLGQMQMYVNYFDRFVKTSDENPTIGIVLCKRKKDALVELTLPKDANIFASQYQLYLPSKEELQQQLQSNEFDQP
jgi:predicted nuclease of restriction endonuclease-like (RecB) superfamily